MINIINIHRIHAHSSCLVKPNITEWLWTLYSNQWQKNQILGDAANTIEEKTPQTESCSIWFYFRSVLVDFYAQIGWPVSLNNSIITCTWRIWIKSFLPIMKKRRQVYSSDLANTILKSSLRFKYGNEWLEYYLWFLCEIFCNRSQCTCDWLN